MPAGCNCWCCIRKEHVKRLGKEDKIVLNFASVLSGRVKNFNPPICIRYCFQRKLLSIIVNQNKQAIHLYFCITPPCTHRQRERVLYQSSRYTGVQNWKRSALVSKLKVGPSRHIHSRAKINVFNHSLSSCSGISFAMGVIT